MLCLHRRGGACLKKANASSTVQSLLILAGVPSCFMLASLMAASSLCITRSLVSRSRYAAWLLLLLLLHLDDTCRHGPAAACKQTLDIWHKR